MTTDDLTVEVERLRGVLARIGALVWYERLADDDAVEAVRVMARERDEARRDLVALLAVIHRDGGHRTGEFGVSQSVADAHATWAVVVRERDEARAEVERLRSERDHERMVANEQLARAHDAVMERDAARAEVERLRAEVERLRRERDEQIAEAASWRATARDKGYSAREVAKDRDKARAEVERLRGDLARCREVQAMRRERDESRAEVEQLPGDAGLNYWLRRLMRERDEARAEVERLRGDLARCREVQKATAEGWRHEVAEVASIVGAPPHTAELAACVRAEVERLRRERDAAEAEIDRLQDERNEAQDEIDRLRAALAQAQRADE